MTVTVVIFATRDTETPTERVFTATEVRTSHGGDLAIINDGAVLFTVDANDMRNLLARVRITPAATTLSVVDALRALDASKTNR